jgi:quinol monooxygenase YgiN
MILALLEMYPQPGKRKDIIDIFQSGQGQILVKPGCLSCELLAGIQEDKLVYIEKWESYKEFSRHLGSVDYFRILNALEFASRPPNISFFEIRDEKGMEVIEQIRNGQEMDEV